MFVFICVKSRTTFGIVTTPLCQLTIIIVRVIFDLVRACFFGRRDSFSSFNTLSLPRPGVTSLLMSLLIVLIVAIHSL